MSLHLVQPNVPVIGQPCKVYQGTVSAVIVCSCRQDNPPLLIPSLNTVVVCDHCRNMYQIAQCQFDATKGMGGPRIGVAMVGKMPEEGQAGSVSEN